LKKGKQALNNAKKQIKGMKKGAGKGKKNQKRRKG